MSNIFLNIKYMDFPVNNQIMFQDVSTSIMQMIVNLHNHIMFLIFGILIFVSRIFYVAYKSSFWFNNMFSIILSNFYIFDSLIKSVANGTENNNILKNKYLNFKTFVASFNLNVYHGTLLEIIWTIIPSCILLLIVKPSFSLLYAMDGFVNPDVTIKVIAHQWFWSYEYSDYFPSSLSDNKFNNATTVYIPEDLWNKVYFQTSLTSLEEKSFENYQSIIDVKKAVNVDFNVFVKWGSDFYSSYVGDIVRHNDKSYLPINIDANSLEKINSLSNGILNYQIDSYMVATSDLNYGDLRLLEVDNPLYLPIYSTVRFDITSDDVMHCFAVPSLGVKVDAIPGRLNIAYAEILREGVYFGQCSELCGVNHGFMPIKIIAVDLSAFFKHMFLNTLN